VLYLRSFKDDALLQFGGWEEQFATALQAIGPVVAIGRPGESLPPLGAARTYVSGEDWQQVVAEWLPRAALVVVRLGETDGVWWEVEQAAARVPPERLLLLVPAEREPYVRVRERLGPFLAHALPAHDARLPSLTLPSRSWRSVTGVWLVCFRADGTPRLLGPGGGHGLPRWMGFGLMVAMLAADRDLRRALRPVFDQLHVVATPPVARARRALVVVMPAFAVLLIVVFVGILSASFAVSGSRALDASSVVDGESPDWRSCAGDSAGAGEGVRVAIIRGCTAVIHSGAEPADRLAAAFHNRGTVYADSGQYAEAIRDLDQAVRLDANDTAAFVTRGYAHAGEGRYDRDRGLRPGDPARPPRGRRARRPLPGTGAARAARDGAGRLRCVGAPAAAGPRPPR
jgi:hypothetical protein